MISCFGLALSRASCVSHLALSSAQGIAKITRMRMAHMNGRGWECATAYADLGIS